MNDSIASDEQDLSLDLDELRSKLNSDSEKTQVHAISKLVAVGEVGLDLLMEFLLTQQAQPPNPVKGEAYQILYSYSSNLPKAKNFLENHFPTGVVPLNSEVGADYLPLQQQLVNKNFQQADVVTLEKLCALATPAAVQRKWLYFSEVDRFPVDDLKTLDTLWRVHSQGKFGYSVQRGIWLSVGKNWDKLWEKIGWRSDRTWTRYPQGFTWDLTAPKGHLPLSNQLRGRRVIEALFNHPAFQ